MDAALALLIAIVEVDWRYRTSSALVPSVTFAEVVALVIAITGGLAALAGGRPIAAAALNRAFVTARASMFYLASVPCVVIASLVLGSVDGIHALKDMLPAGVLLALCLFLPATRTRLGRAELALSMVGLAVAVLAVVQALSGGPYLVEFGRTVYAKQGWLAEIRYPAVGPFRHPNGLALFLVPVGILAAGSSIDSIMGRGAWRAGFIHTACAVFATLAVALSAAKLGAGTLLIGIAFRVILAMAHISCTPARAFAVLGVLILSLAAMIALAVGGFTGREGGIPAGTLVARWSLNVSAVEFLATNPIVLLLGGGVGAFVATTPGELQVHNEFLCQVLRFGLVSGFLFVGMIGSAFRGLDRRAWSYALSLCGLFVMLLVEPAEGSQSQAAIMTIMGLCALRRRAVVADIL